MADETEYKDEPRQDEPGSDNEVWVLAITAGTWLTS